MKWNFLEVKGQKFKVVKSSSKCTYISVMQCFVSFEILIAKCDKNVLIILFKNVFKLDNIVILIFILFVFAPSKNGWIILDNIDHINWLSLNFLIIYFVWQFLHVLNRKYFEQKNDYMFSVYPFSCIRIVSSTLTIFNENDFKRNIRSILQTNSIENILFSC